MGQVCKIVFSLEASGPPSRPASPPTFGRATQQRSLPPLPGSARTGQARNPPFLLPRKSGAGPPETLTFLRNKRAGPPKLESASTNGLPRAPRDVFFALPWEIPKKLGSARIALSVFSGPRKRALPARVFLHHGKAGNRPKPNPASGNGDPDPGALNARPSSRRVGFPAPKRGSFSWAFFPGLRQNTGPRPASPAGGKGYLHHGNIVEQSKLGWQSSPHGWVGTAKTDPPLALVPAPGTAPAPLIVFFFPVPSPPSGLSEQSLWEPMLADWAKGKPQANQPSTSKAGPQKPPQSPNLEFGKWDPTPSFTFRKTEARKWGTYFC